MPPLSRVPASPARHPPLRPPSAREAEDLEARILHSDDQLLVIDKPPGLAVQGGSKTLRHLDGMLDALRFGGAAAVGASAGQGHIGGAGAGAYGSSGDSAYSSVRVGKVHKLYWAIVVGVPATATGRIEQPLSKRFGLSASG